MTALRRLAAKAAPVLVIAGCTTVGPEYEPPVIELPAGYGAPIPALFADAPAVEVWWSVFDDPVLDRLIAAGLEQNLDIRVAASRVREARAVARGVVGSTLPQVNAGTDGTFTSVLAGEEDRGDSLLFDLFVDGFYEVDLFGALARSREAAWALAAQEERLAAEAGRISVAEIARSYVQLRAAQRLLGLTEELLELQRQTLELVRERVASGLAPGLDQVRAEAAVASLEADLGPLRSAAGQLRNALAVLLAAPPGALEAELLPPADIPLAETGAALGVPADVLRRRPDVQAAELAIVASTADVGVATADLYPRLTLPGTIALGPFGFAPGDIVTTVLASISALLDYPLFDGGQRRAALTAAEERLLQSGLLYRDTLLGALEEVESALLAYAGTLDRLQALRIAVERNRTAYRQSQQLYRDGFASFIDVLDSQRELNTSLQQLATAEQDLSLAVVDLYSALGGSLPEA
jgi:NodT family efflux transporter outer membrane factor (OMF) lipoprotein